MTVLTVYRHIILKYLKEGYNPFKDNSEFYLNRLKSKLVNESTLKFKVK